MSPRRKSKPVFVGDVQIGGGAPIEVIPLEALGV
jgi:4-hydroxy-3-methylbut-2-en-1-yl diphosphate synthase IspG/GcpE